MTELEPWAAELAGNHRKFASFGWHNRPENDEQYGIVYMTNRDADLLTQSNWETALKLLEEYLEADEPDIWTEVHNHWAVGWVEGFVVRVYDDSGEITPAANALNELREQLEDYPVLDEEDWSQREFDAQHEAIADVYLRKSEKADDLPDDWVEQVWSYLWDNDQAAFDGYDGGVDWEKCEEAMIELGFAIPDEEEADEE